MKTYVAHCDHCGWHYQTTNLADYNWTTATPGKHCNRVPRGYVIEQPALFEFDEVVDHG